MHGRNYKAVNKSEKKLMWETESIIHLLSRLFPTRWWSSLTGTHFCGWSEWKCRGCEVSVCWYHRLTGESQWARAAKMSPHHERGLVAWRGSVLAGLGGAGPHIWNKTEQWVHIPTVEHVLSVRSIYVIYCAITHQYWGSEADIDQYSG